MVLRIVRGPSLLRSPPGFHCLQYRNCSARQRSGNKADVAYL